MFYIQKYGARTIPQRLIPRRARVRIHHTQLSVCHFYSRLFGKGFEMQMMPLLILFVAHGLPLYLLFGVARRAVE
jgi:hypothetical protein